MKIILNVLLAITIVMLLSSCNTTEPPSNQTLTLKLEDVSCTEAWIQLTTTNLQLPAAVNVLKNNSVTQTFRLSTQDTLLYIDSLLPNQTYKLKVSSIQNPESNISSNELTVTTMDTTSHNFTWQTFTFGENGAGSSALYDVAIIDENNIWAVGAIYMNDSLGNPDPNAYNALHWDGQSWKLFKLQFFTFCGQPYTGSYPAKAIFAFDQNNIIISSGSQLTYLNGNVQTKTECVPVSVNKLWGSSSNDLYAVGNDGSIAHYNTGYWQKMESGTNIDLTDIYGTSDGQSIFVCGWDWNTGNSIILNISNFNNPKVILNNIYNEDDRIFASLWTDGKQIILGGNRVFRRYLINDALNESVVNTELVPTDYGSKWFLPGYFIYSLRGTGLNNLFIAGDGGMIWHFNGISWYQYEGLFATNRRLYGTAVKDNIFAAVGTNSRALIIIGKR